MSFLFVLPFCRFLFFFLPFFTPFFFWSLKKKQEKDSIPNMELILIGAFFVSFLFWAVSKCTVTQSKYEQEAALNAPKKIKDSIVHKEIKPVSIDKPIKKIAKTKTVIKEVSILYAVVEGLKLRKGPTRDSSIIKELTLNEPIYFLNEVTPFKEKINMGSYIAEEPWLKIRTKKGYEGWVYGAGVNYYKVPAKIVEEEEE